MRKMTINKSIFIAKIQMGFEVLGQISIDFKQSLQLGNSSNSYNAVRIEFFKPLEEQLEGRRSYHVESAEGVGISGFVQ